LGANLGVAIAHTTIKRMHKRLPFHRWVIALFWWFVYIYWHRGMPELSGCAHYVWFNVFIQFPKWHSREVEFEFVNISGHWSLNIHLTFIIGSKSQIAKINDFQLQFMKHAGSKLVAFNVW
jgi:hypothetical protein